MVNRERQIAVASVEDENGLGGRRWSSLMHHYPYDGHAYLNLLYSMEGENPMHTFTVWSCISV